MFIVLLMSLADIYRPVVTGQLVDSVVAAVGGNSDSIGAYEMLILFMAVSVFSLAVKWLHSRIWNRFAATNMHELLEETFDKVQHFSSDWHANTFAGATVRKVTRGKASYDSMSDIFWVHFLQLGIMLIGASAIMAWRFPIVGIVFSSTTIFYIAVSVWLAAKYVRPANVKSAEADSAIGAALADSITNNPAVKAFGAEDREYDRFLLSTRKWSQRAKISWNRGQDLAAIQQILWTALQLITMFVLINLTLNGHASIGDLTFLLTTTFVLGGRVRQVGDHIRQLQRASSEFADVVDIHKRQPQIADPATPASLLTKKGRVEFDDVTFSYGEASTPIYNNFSIDIKPGEKIGLVGASGAGKSTFVKLIQRLYDIDHGVIRLDGQAIDEVSQSTLRQNIALVPQDPHLFHRSLAENIAYAKPDATMDEIVEAATRARASNFINSLTYGYDTLVGERGVKLSGGERQRVAIARAFLADAPIVIFDEATSSLDTITEKHIQDAMAELMEGRTTLIIAHRLSTVHDVDRILVFDDGRIVEQGNHQTLMQQEEGIYRALYEMQGKAA